MGRGGRGEGREHEIGVAQRPQIQSGFVVITAGETYIFFNI